MPRPLFEKKTVYHSQLVSAGPIVVKILSDVQKSKFKKGDQDQYYVAFSHDGNEHQYICENRDCEDALADLKGKTVCIEATGGRDDAAIEVSAASSGSRDREPSRSESRERREEQRPRDDRREPEQSKRLPVMGQTVGMALNNALKLAGDAVLQDDTILDPLAYFQTPKFNKAVFVIASDIIRNSRLLEEGQLAKPARDREASHQEEPPRQPPPPQQPTDKDLDASGDDIPF